VVSFGKPNPAQRKVLRVIVTIAVLSVVLWFFSSSLLANWGRVQEFEFRLGVNTFLGIALWVAAVPVSGWLWRATLRAMSPNLSVTARDAISTHCLSWVLKYIPGQVGSFANKVLWASRRGISRAMVSLSFIYENIMLQLASIVPSVMVLLFALGGDIFLENPATLLLPLSILLPLAFVAIGPVFQPFAIWAARRLLRREIDPEYFLSSGHTLALLLGYLLPRVLNGAGFVLVATDITDVAPDVVLPLAVTYVLAGAIGILAIFVPSGLGVREAVIVIIASQFIPLADAILLSLLARLYATVADAAVAGLYLAIRPRQPDATAALH
jgi:hypothetical protein